MVKTVLKSVLSKSQYEACSRIKKLGRMGVESAALGALRCLPDTSQINLRNKSVLVRKMTYPKRDVFIYVDSHIEYYTRVNSHRHEPDTVHWIETAFQPGDVFYDIGANIGSYSLITAKFWDKKISSYAFEPGYMNYYKLCANVALNGAADCVMPFQVALSDESKLDTFYYESDIIGDSGKYLGEPVDYLGKTFEPKLQLPVLSYRLDDFTEFAKIPPPNHIKIDVDGIEALVLKGGSKALSNPSLRTILIEMEGRSNIEEIEKFITQKGFKETAKREHADPGVYNYIYFRENN